MNETHGQMLFISYALHVHEAGGVRTGDVFGSSGYVTFHLVYAHAATDGLLFYGKHASEAAALVGTLWL